MSQAPLGQDGIADVVQDDDVIVHVDGQNGMGQAAQGIAQDDDTQFVRIHAQLFEREIFDDGVIFAVARFFEEQVGPDPVVGLAPVGDILTVRKAVTERIDIAQQFHAAFALRPLFEGIPGGGPGEDLAADEDGLQLVHAADLSPGGQAVERAPELHGPEQGDGGGLRREPRPLPPNFSEMYELWKTGKISAVKAAKQCGMARSTFRYRAESIKSLKIEHGKKVYFFGSHMIPKILLQK